jgi:glycyl-tRNA synthetase beta chain
VMVMAEDERLRHNRLALLLRLSRLIYSFADFSKIVFA